MAVQFVPWIRAYFATVQQSSGMCLLYVDLNLFMPNAPFLYPLKTSEKITVFRCFQGVEEGCIGKKWVKCLKIANISLLSACELQVVG